MNSQIRIKGKFYVLLVGIKLCKVNKENKVVPQKLKIELSDSESSLLGIYPKKSKQDLKAAFVFQCSLACLFLPYIS